MLSATSINAWPLLQNFNFKVSCVWSQFLRVILVVWNKISFIGILASNLDSENMISIYTSDFSQKKLPKFAK
jgi:hypothetical protein